MKHTQTLAAFVIGALVGGGAIAATSTGGSVDRAEVEAIVKEYIEKNGGAIMTSVQKWQEEERSGKIAKANESLKSPEIQKAIYENPHSAVVGNPDAKAVVVEFFDYNCPACKMAFKAIDELLAKDKSVKVIFKEFPIFGPQSDMNSKIGLAVYKLDPSKYYDFHKKMMSIEGRVDGPTAFKFAEEVGIKEADLKAEVAKPEYDEIITSMKKLASDLGLQGTPSIIVGDELIPHALEFKDLEEKVSKLR